MFTRWLEWWDGHGWVALVVIAITIAYVFLHWPSEDDR
jgi:hypothetical protein